MSRISKWKFEKTKVKVVFRLQFHATHIPQSGWDKLFISLISAETGKATAKTTKANVKNGACKWGDAIYETTRLLQDSKNKQYEEKLYKIVVAMGSSRASTLGEATMNLSDYVDALKPSTVAVPLHGCNFGTILHITVQLLTSKTGFREFEHQRELRERGFRSGVDGHGDSNTGDQTDKVGARIKSKADTNELSSLEEEVNLNEDYADSNSAAGFDGSSNTSESLNTEKHEIDPLKNISFKQSPHALRADAPDHQHLPQESSNNSINNELAIAFEENIRLKGILELAESSIFNLKLEVSSLQTLADELGSDTQKISNVLAFEIISTEELAKEVSFMKSECRKFKDDMIKLKDLKLSSQIPIMEASDYSVGSKNGFGLDLCQPDSILQNFSIIPPVLEVSNPVVDAMKSQIFDLVRELDESKVEKEALTQKMDQMECYYESLIHELEENQKLMLVELNHVRSEHSTCIYTLSSSRADMESMHQEMLRLADERLVIEEIGKELERRVITSEAALRRARLNYSIAVDKLQKDLELLSSQVAFMFETNECIIKQAFVEPSEVDDTEKFQISNLVPRKRSVGGDIILEDLKRSFCLQEELYQKTEKELIDMYSLNLNLDLYSKALEGSLLEANSDIRILNKKTEELSEELELSTASQNQLMVRLQEAKEEVHTLNEFKSSSISQCSDMALQNQVLEDKLESISVENHHLFAQKLKDLDITKTSYQSKFETCLSENAELSVSLKREVSENEKLQIEMSILKAESEEVVSLKNNLEDNISFVQNKLANLLLNYSKQLNVSATSYSINSKDAILHLEEIQNNARGKILKLMEENQNLKGERDIADVSLSRAQLEIHAMKEKFKSEIHGMVTKLNLSNALVGKLQTELESVATKLRFSSEIDEAYCKQNEVLLADLTVFENQMHELTSKNGLVSREISGFDDLAEEIVRGKLMISDLMHDKQELVLSFQDKTEEAINLASEIGCLKEDLRILQEDLIKEKIYKDELEGKVQELNSQLNVENDKFSMSLQEKNEVSVKLVSEINSLKEDLKNLHDELHKETVSKDELERKIVDLTARLMKGNEKYLKSLQGKIEDSIKLVSEINSLKEDVRNLHDELRKEKVYEKELEGKVGDLTSQLKMENDKFSFSLQEKNEELVKLAFEIGSLKENLRNLDNELHKEKAYKDELEGKVQDLTSQLNKETDKLALSLQEKNEESVKLVSEVNCLKEDLRNLHDELCKEKIYEDELEDKARDLISQLNKENNNYVKSLHEKNEESIKLLSEKKSLEEDLRNLHDELHKEKVYKEELEGNFRNLTSQLKKDNDKVSLSLHEKNEESVKFASEIDCLKENLRKLNNELHKEKTSKNETEGKVRDLKDKLLNLEQQNAELLGVRKLASDIEMVKLQEELSYQETQLFEMHDYLLAADLKLIYFTNQYKTVIEELFQKLMSSQKCLEELQKQYHDLEAMSNHYIANEAHWTEEKSNLLKNLNSLSDSNNDMRNQLDESLDKLEFAEMRFSVDENVIIDLEEEINSSNVIKEELEISILVLQGKALEKCAEVAYLSRKLSEQVLETKEYKNLSTHLNELKDELEAECLVAHEKRVVVAVQDSLRVAFIKEHYETKIQELNHKFSISKKHGEEMLIKLQDSIDEIENRKRSEALNSKKNEELSLKLLALESELQLAVTEKREKISAYDRTKAELECALLSLECCKEEKEKLEALLQECEAGKSELAVELTLAKGELEILKSPIKGENGSVTKIEYKLNGSTRNSSPIWLEWEDSIPDGESAASNETTQLQVLEDATFKSVYQIPEALDIGESPKSNGKHLDTNGEFMGAQILRSSMEHLHEQLEKMKNENAALDNNHETSDFQVPGKEITQLHKANEELRSLFPSFDEISGGGNALEKVLALEIELAEALKSKNNQNSLLQSSFLKQQSNEDAVLKTFRDINELIKEMLELKGKHANVETELRDMHERYSQLSLQFAEVEGERQKLKMTLKNVRASKKLLRSSSSDLPS